MRNRLAAKSLRRDEAGFTLFEILIAMVLLAMVAAMIYSVLNVGIKFTDRGGRKILAMERKYGFLILVQRQITSAVYDPVKKRILMSADDEIFKVVTRNPFIYPEAGVVLAIYRYNAGERAIYYTEKRDYYNKDYSFKSSLVSDTGTTPSQPGAAGGAIPSPLDGGNEDYVPGFDEMTVLAQDEEPFSVKYDEAASPEVMVTYRGEQYTLVPKSADAAAKLKLVTDKK